MGKLFIGDKTGHKELEWTAENKEAIKEASKAFADKLKDGYFAAEYRGDSTDPKNGKLTRTFDETADKIKMMPFLVGG